MRNPSRLPLVLLLTLGCSTPSKSTAPPAPRGPVTISVVGTTDLHGRVERTAVLGGYLANLRKARAKDGAVLLVDAGDMFQGTLESNPNEGAAVVRAYNALGYHAAAIGNHEFDFGPVGPNATARAAGEDPRGALKARAAQAAFPFLAANIVNDDGTPLDWPNTAPSTLVELSGVKVGIIGVTSMGTPRTTIASNFAGLKMTPVAEAITREASALKGKGARIVVVLAHLGGGCKKLNEPKDLSSCKQHEEAFDLARELPAGSVDVMVAGHTHQGIAHEVNGIAVIQAFANGSAFGRVDVTLDGSKRDLRIVGVQDLCEGKDVPLDACNPSPYEGAPVALDETVLKAISVDVEKARALRGKLLNVEIKRAINRGYADESALGNLVADLMRKGRPGVDAAITNGGGLRADLPEGPLTYGALYEALPFDNRFATVKMRAGDLRQVFQVNLGKQKGGILLISGINVLARCEHGTLNVTLTREDGSALPDDTELTIATSDFLATGGDGVFGVVKLPPEAVVLDEGPPIREVLAELLEKQGGALSGDDPMLFSTATRRLDFSGKRPVRCGN